jgi:dienelactone hydrolase
MMEGSGCKNQLLEVISTDGNYRRFLIEPERIFASLDVPQSRMVGEMKTRLSFGGKAAQASEFVIYPDAPHAFHADYRPTYRREAAEDGFARALAWFKKHGVS